MNHSKKQITEAIKYWKNILQRINESKSRLLNIFAKEFGENVVFSNKSFDLNDDNVKIIYQIFKENFFKNR